MRGIGTIDNPWDLAAAFASKSVAGGDTLVLSAGVYKDPPSPIWNGGNGYPVRIVAAPGERVVFDGNFNVTTRWLQFEGIEFAYSGWTARASAIAGSSPADVPYMYANLRGNNCTYIGCIFHDLRGVLWYSDGGEMHDCLSYYHGWQGPDRKHGHAYYIHNGPNPKRMTNCLGFDCFGYGVALYGYVASDVLDNVSFDGCYMFGSGGLPVSGDNYNWHIGGEAGVSAKNISVRQCGEINGLRPRLGYTGGATLAALNDNYFPGGVTRQNLAVAEEAGNQYSYKDFAICHPSEVIPGRGLVFVSNTEAVAESVTVDVSAVLAAGDAYRLRSAWNYYGDVATGEVGQDGTIAVDMRAASYTPVAPVALQPKGAAMPTYGAFILERE